MYRSFRQFCDYVLCLPPDPKPPPGDENSTRIFRAAPSYFTYLLVVRGLKVLGAIIALLVTVSIPLSAGLKQLENRFSIFPLMFEVEIFLAVLGGASALILVRLDYEKRWYLVTDRSFRIREGVWIVKEMTVNFANIQNLTISQGPVQRLLGIADLRVDTAGGGGGSTKGEEHGDNLHTAWFRGISNVGEVRALIQQRLTDLKDAGLGDERERLQPAYSGEPARWETAQVLDAARGILEEARALRTALTSDQKPNETLNN